jgi:hypothetical protein
MKKTYATTLQAFVVTFLVVVLIAAINLVGLAAGVYVVVTVLQWMGVLPF